MLKHNLRKLRNGRRETVHHRVHREHRARNKRETAEVAEDAEEESREVPIRAPSAQRPAHRTRRSIVSSVSASAFPLRFVSPLPPRFFRVFGVFRGFAFRAVFAPPCRLSVFIGVHLWFPSSPAFPAPADLGGAAAPRSQHPMYSEHTRATNHSPGMAGSAVGHQRPAARRIVHPRHDAPAAAAGLEAVSLLPSPFRESGGGEGLRRSEAVSCLALMA
jgi:hypothetical protein